MSPPEGWPPAPQAEETWALQTLYSTAAKDMTPCATRSAIPTIPPAAAADSSKGGRFGAQHQHQHQQRGLLGENRSSCAAYMGKAGANYSYVRDEHCCFLNSNLPGIDGNLSNVASLYLLYSPAANDHMLASNKSYRHGPYAYATDSIECFGYENQFIGFHRESAREH